MGRGVNDPGHRNTWGSTGRQDPGWPSFGPDGKIVREVDPEVCRSPLAGPDKLCVKMCGSRCEWARS